MPLERMYKALGLEILALREKRRAPHLHFRELEGLLLELFTRVVDVERALDVDDYREVTNAIGNVALFTLYGLMSLNPDWALRTPVHRPGRYDTGAVLTKDLRQRLVVVTMYWRRGEARDTTMALELVLKSVLELASRLDLDPYMAALGQKPTIEMW